MPEINMKGRMIGQAIIEIEEKQKNNEYSYILRQYK